MKLFENYNSAVGKYGEPLVRKMLSDGIPNRYLLSACRFHCSPPKKSIDILKVQFRQWMTYVVPYIRGIDVNNLTYEQFDKTIRDEQQKYICPNPIYDDGNITIGEFKNKKDAAMCPLEPICDNDYDFCVCSEMGYNKYSKQGYRILVINDKSKALSSDNTKYVFALVKNGVVDLRNANNLPIGSTEKPYGNEAWQYIDNLPDNAQEALLTFAEQTKPRESKTRKNMKQKTINEAQLRAIVKESVNKVLKESESADVEYQDILTTLGSSYDEYSNAIRDLQKWYLINVEGGKDMYNSYAGKYGDEAIALLRQSLNRLGDMLKVDAD